MSRFVEAFEQYQRRRLTAEEADELLGMSGRNFRRLCIRYEEDGLEGLRDQRIGKVSPRRAPARELERMHKFYFKSARRPQRPVGLWTTQARCPQVPQAQPQQQKRTNDVLQTADIFTRYGQHSKIDCPWTVGPYRRVAVGL